MHEGKFVVAGLSLLLVVLLGCIAAFALPDWWEPNKRAAATSGVEALVAQVHTPPEITLLQVIPEDFTDADSGGWKLPSCFYGRRFIVIGSAQSSDTIIQAYAAQLEQIGFRRHVSQYEQSADFERDERERALIEMLPPWTAFYDANQAPETWRKYQTLMVITFEYYIPSRSAC